MAGIYIHIPFCRKACTYCNFHFSTSFNRKDDLLASLKKEITLQHAYLNQERIETIYFGGGTPSALAPSDIDQIITQIHSKHQVARDAEITLEANPEDLNQENLSAWKTSGVNRLSLGVQGFQDEMLHAWNRSHAADQAFTSLVLAKAGGFDNVSADLIYGDPSLSDEAWIRNLNTLAELQIPHLSCYALTVETGTALFHQIQKRKTQPVDEEHSFRQFELLQSTLMSLGYEQYEISNFSKPGAHSKHNSGYWSGRQYLGIGPSAHSFNGLSRQWNVSNNSLYIQALADNKIPCETEVLTPDKMFNERIMTGLRTAIGIDPNQIKQLSPDYLVYLERNIAKYLRTGQIRVTESGNYALVRDQYFFADGIASDLFLLPDTSLKI